MTKRLIVLLALLLAVFFRFWQLDSLPPGLYHDEAYNGLDALSLTQGRTFPIFYEGWELYAQDAHAERPPNETRFPVFFEGNYGREPLHVYLMAISVALLGATPFAIRAVPAISGVLAVLTTYFAADVLLNGRKSNNNYLQLAPAFSALTLAILFPAIHFSRFGIRAMVFVPIETLTVALFWLGIQSLNQKHNHQNKEHTNPNVTPSLHHSITPSLYFALSGLLLGLGIYTYAAARLFPLLFILFIPLWLWRSGTWRHDWKYAGLMAGASILTALPLLLFFFRYPYFFIFRIAFVSNKGRGTVDGRPILTWLYNIGRVIRGLIWQGETHLRHNLPGRPYLDPIQLGLFLTGIVSYFRRWNRLRPIFLALWLVVMLLPTVLSGDAPHFGRMTGAAPVVSILVGIGAAYLFSVISDRYSVFSNQYSVISIQSKKQKPTNHLSLITIHYSLLTIYFLLFLASSAITYRDYFIRYANHPEIETDFYLADWQLGEYGAEQPADTALYLTPTQEEMATIYFALADAERMRSYAGGNGLVPLGEPEETAVYFIRPENNNALTQLDELSNNPLEGVELNGVLAVNGRITPDDFASYTPSTHQWQDKISLQAYDVAIEEAQIVVKLLWQAEGEMERPYTAFVHLLDADGNVISQLDRPPAGYPTTDWRSGEWIHDTYTVPLPDGLPANGYTIQTGFYYLPTLELLGETAVLVTSP